MRRFFVVWVICWLLNLLATLAISVGGFGHLDLRYETFAANHLVPALQAAVLAGLLSRPDWRAGLRHLRHAARHPLAQVVLVLDVLVLGTFLYARDSPLVGLAAPSPVPQAWLGTKLAAAGLGFLFSSWRAAWRPRSWPATGVVLLGLAAEAFWHWNAPLVGLVAPRLPTVLRWLIVGVPAFCAIVWLVLRAADEAPRDTPVAAWISAALALFAVVAVVTAVSWFLRPFFVEPWGLVARLAASLCASCLLVAALTSAVRTHES